ncbi:MAG: ATP-dependent Clp protease ATP-binding subunit [bacterium]|nr:ATP-dependent Clp protease ATP-binding subunit [bacterium]
MFSPDLLNRFTTHLKEALQKALSFAISCGRDEMRAGDLIVGLLHEKGSIASELLTKIGFSAESAEEHFRGDPEPPRDLITPDLAPPVKRILEKCILTAHVNEHKYVGTEHLLLALLECTEKDVVDFFKTKENAIRLMKDQVGHVLQSTSRFPELGSAPIENEIDEATPLSPRPQPTRTTRVSALEAFSRELTTTDVSTLLDPVIGREPELDRVIEILCRRTKNNPILIGDPGVGKTAIVEGLATRISSGDVPDTLYGKRVLSLDLALTVAGTMYRGEFEARLKSIIDEARHDPNVILFIDEIHTIVGAGSTSGSLDAANMLKPALARGEIRCIGATTWGEFKKHIEPDAALERRFQPVPVHEPTPEAAYEMLCGIEGRYAEHHNVKYAPEALRAAIDLGNRFVTDRLFPDKAIDLIDEAAAFVISRRQSRETMERLTSLDLAISVSIRSKEEAVQQGRLDDAEAFANTTQKLKSEHEELTNTLKREQNKNIPIVTANDVARVVARMSGVPLALILATERERLSQLNGELHERIMGQDNAITELCDVVRRGRMGLGDTHRPKTAVMFVGPSGTGKTEMARALATSLFRREDALIKIDMSEFSEGHTVSKLVGSPAGYVGYREGTKLTDAVRKRPHSVVLFDEFEKAHADVQNILLQILEDGQITDSTGRTISFRQSYIILTSNIGSDKLNNKGLGFGASEQGFSASIKSELSQHLRPELLNRLDRILVFEPLARKHLKQILQRELFEILERVERTQRVACLAGDDILEWLLEQPMPQEEGARAIRRIIEREIVALVSKTLTEKPRKRKITFDIEKKMLKVR